MEAIKEHHLKRNIGDVCTIDADGQNIYNGEKYCKKSINKQNN